KVADNEYKSKKAGVVAFERLTVVANNEGQHIALARTGEITILNKKGGLVVERYGVPNGAEVYVKDGQEVQAGTPLVKWDPHSIPIICEEGGKVRWEDIKEGETMRRERTAAGVDQYTIIEHKGDMHPQVLIEDARGNVIKAYFIPERANVQVRNGDMATPGIVLAKTPREVSKTQDITGGLPRVTELFEARRPRNPAVMATVAGKIRIDPTKKRGKRIIWIQPEDPDTGKTVGEEREHQVPAGAQPRVHDGE